MGAAEAAWASSAPQPARRRRLAGWWVVPRTALWGTRALPTPLSCWAPNWPMERSHWHREASCRVWPD